MLHPHSDVRFYYGKHAANEDSRLQSRQLEHDMTLALLEEHLPKRAKILEVGAGSGHYTLALLSQGHHVTAVDLSPELISLARHRLRVSGYRNWRTMVADAKTLVGVAGNFDVCLVMGPMYQLTEVEDRSAALRSIWKRLVPSGLLVSSWMNRYGVLSQLLATSPDWAKDNAAVFKLIDHGVITDQISWYCERVDELAPFHGANGFEKLSVFPADPGIFGTDHGYNLLEAGLRRRWLTILRRMAEEPSMIGSSRHMLYFGQKVSN